MVRTPGLLFYYYFLETDQHFLACRSPKTLHILSLLVFLWPPFYGLRSNFLNASQAQTKSSAINEYSKETPLNLQIEFLYTYFLRGGMLRDSIYLVKKYMKGFLFFSPPFSTFLMTNHFPHPYPKEGIICLHYAKYFCFIFTMEKALNSAELFMRP